MIYCTDFDLVEAHVLELGFERSGETDAHVLYGRGEAVVVLHKPNLDRHVTEISVLRAFDEAGLEPFDWPIFWCD